MNDNPPELATPYEAAVCEDAKPGQVPPRGWGRGSCPPRVAPALPSAPPSCPQLIQTISVVDRDEPQGGHRFYFRLVPEAPSNPHFSLLDIQGECVPAAHPSSTEGGPASSPSARVIDGGTETPRGPVPGHRRTGPRWAVTRPAGPAIKREQVRVGRGRGTEGRGRTVERSREGACEGTAGTSGQRQRWQEASRRPSQTEAQSAPPSASHGLPRPPWRMVSQPLSCFSGDKTEAPRGRGATQGPPGASGEQALGPQWPQMQVLLPSSRLEATVRPPE